MGNLQLILSHLKALFKKVIRPFSPEIIHENNKRKSSPIAINQIEILIKEIKTEK